MGLTSRTTGRHGVVVATPSAIHLISLESNRPPKGASAHATSRVESAGFSTLSVRRLRNVSSSLAVMSQLVPQHPKPKLPQPRQQQSAGAVPVVQLVVLAARLRASQSPSATARPTRAWQSPASMGSEF